VSRRSWPRARGEPVDRQSQWDGIVVSHPFRTKRGKDGAPISRTGREWVSRRSWPRARGEPVDRQSQWDGIVVSQVPKSEAPGAPIFSGCTLSPDTWATCPMGWYRGFPPFPHKTRKGWGTHLQWLYSLLPTPGPPARRAAGRLSYLASAAIPACSARVAALSVASQVKSGSLRPKWP